VINTNGDVIITNHSDLTVGNISGENVSLEAASGSILDDTDETNKITGDTVSLTALTNIGSISADGEINTKANTIAADAGGDIYIEEEDGATYSSIVAGGLAKILAHGESNIESVITGGLFTFSNSTGNINLYGTISSTNTDDTGGVILSALEGSIYAFVAGPHIVVNGTADSLLSVPTGVIAVYGAGVVGGVPIDISMPNANLLLNIGGSVDTISGFLTGNTLLGTLIFEPAILTPQPHPPGAVFFNNILIWPTLDALGTSQAYNSLTLHIEFAGGTMWVYYIINPFGGSPVYFYHPLTESDWSAFDELDLGDDAYQFMDGGIGILGHDGLLSILEELKKKKK
jgi:hypothetical protein